MPRSASIHSSALVAVWPRSWLASGKSDWKPSRTHGWEWSRRPISSNRSGARAALEVGVKTLQWGRYASEYDGVIAPDIARVLTGGDLSLPQWVPEEYLLQLEKEAFLSLLRNDKTQARIVAMLESGKPLRN